MKQPKKVDAYLRAALRAAAYQILFLSRVPPHAAVSDAVALVKRERGPRLAGVANAVLRKIERPAAPSPPDRVEVPPWVGEAIARGLGQARGGGLPGGAPAPASPRPARGALERGRPRRRDPRGAAGGRGG
ncbi:MAG: transcription antitermination protein NusB [Sandaracinaceae bacterium]|nr:transcription antitermination protein NusB [Sandaracinaceae bacterium]